MKHLQQDNIKEGAAGDRGRAAGATAAAAQGEVQHLQQDSVKVETAGGRGRAAGSAAAAAAGSQKKDVQNLEVV